jgi:DNA invertase Pin-like site-specific DNA recombinase
MRTAQTLAYSYLRFSHPSQSDGDSIRRQTELRDGWIARNGVTLDTSMTLEDKGVSGYTGEHRNNPDRYALASFVGLVREKQIARGSYLVVENLDRLSREDILPALSLVLDLIQSGIRIVQLLPAEMIYDQKANPMHVMMMIMELSRGHSESQMKSERVGSAWREKKRLAAENGVPITARAPAWLRLVDGQWKIDAEAAEIIRRIFRMATEGYGTITITKKLNADKVRHFGRGDHWPRSYVNKILANRAVLGEYQPYKGRGTKRQPDGKPIPGYYPAIITEQEFYAARAGLASRKGKPGRLPKQHVNLFTGLINDALSGGSVHLVDKGKRGGKRLESYKAAQGVLGTHYATFPFESFERAVLSLLREIDPKSVLPRLDNNADESLAIAGRLAVIESEIEQNKRRLRSRYSDAVADVLETHEAEAKALMVKLAEARQREASPLNEAWGEYRSLLDILETAPDPEEARVMLRAALRRIVQSIWCVFVGRGAVRLAGIQVWFAGGAHRDYLIVHRGGSGGSVGNRPAQWWARSLPSDMAKRGLDLRRKRDAKALSKFLTDVEVSSLVDAMREGRADG